MNRSQIAPAVAALLFAASFVTPVPARADGDAVRGEYLAHISDCGGCHTPGANTPEPDMTHPLAGNEIGFELPGMGIFYPPNLTPDIGTGLGGWTDDEIVHAIRTGERPDGRILAPIMPYMSYAAYSDEDIRDLVAYLRSLEPMSHQVPGPIGPGETPPAPYMTMVMPSGG